MFAESRELLRSGAIRRHQFGQKGTLTRVLSVVVIWDKTCYAGYNHL